MNAKDNNTFSPKVLSLPKDSYESMVRTLHLPFGGIETSAVVGPFFWCSYDYDEEDPHLREHIMPYPFALQNRLTQTAEIIHRKSDVRKKGKTRGWEMMLSYSFKSRITKGYLKGTPSSDIIKALEHLKASLSQVGHPLLLPTIILSYDLSPDNDKKQRDAREWLRRLENAVSLRNEVDEDEQYFQNGLLEIDGLSRDLVECHSHVMWKRPQAFAALTKEMEKGMDLFRAKFDEQTENPLLSDDRTAEAWKKEKKMLEKLHRSMLARMDFFLCKLKGLENYIVTTLERLKVQREAVSHTLL